MKMVNLDPENELYVTGRVYEFQIHLTYPRSYFRVFVNGRPFRQRKKGVTDDPMWIESPKH